MRTAVVTGAASGIGRALARQLAAEGHRVHLADISSTEQLAAEIDGIPAVVEVSSDEQMNSLAARAANAEVVCLNAGIVGPSLGAPWEVPTDEWVKLLEVNVLGVVNGLRAFVPAMVAANRPANIVITASLAGLLTFPSGGAYSGHQACRRDNRGAGRALAPRHPGHAVGAVSSPGPHCHVRGR